MSHMNPWKDAVEAECEAVNVPFNETSPNCSLELLCQHYEGKGLESCLTQIADITEAAKEACAWEGKSSVDIRHALIRLRTILSKQRNRND